MPRYQGTTDVIEDFDAVYLAQPLVSNARPDQRLVKLTNLKSRGMNPEMVAYAYSKGRDINYEEMVATVHAVPICDLDDYAVQDEDVGDPLVMDTILRLIGTGWDGGKMALAKAAAKECGVSERGAIKVIEQYGSDDPPEHQLWRVRRGHRGVRIYEPAERPAPPS